MSEDETAETCANWHDGRCQACGVPWQYFEVSADFKCPHWESRPTEAEIQAYAAHLADTDRSW